MGLKYRAPKECSPVVLKAKLGCEDWLTPEVNASRDTSTLEPKTAFKVVTIEDFNAGCCYDTSSNSTQSNLEAAQFDGLDPIYMQKWPVISGVGNFIVIQTMGQVYEGVAYWLNDQENYRFVSLVESLESVHFHRGIIIINDLLYTYSSAIYQDIAGQLPMSE